MNKDRRDRLAGVSGMIQEAIDELQDIVSEEQEAFDNMPDGLQCSARGEAIQGYIDDMESLIDKLDVCDSELNKIINKK